MRIEIPTPEGSRRSPEAFEAETAEDLLQALMKSKAHATARIVELSQQLQALHAEAEAMRAQILAAHRLLRLLRSTPGNHLTRASRSTLDSVLVAIESEYL